MVDQGVVLAPPGEGIRREDLLAVLDRHQGGEVEERIGRGELVQDLLGALAVLLGVLAILAALDVEEPELAGRAELPARGCAGSPAEPVGQAVEDRDGALAVELEQTEGLLERRLGFRRPAGRGAALRLEFPEGVDVLPLGIQVVPAVHGDQDGRRPLPLRGEPAQPDPFGEHHPERRLARRRRPRTGLRRRGFPSGSG